eukprot:TRINITY_DN9761_c0_g1_i1.p1 TRINITY_DN9761_c0_g1~~TRINITY_DN9761_c0_g1_i1.p1  ORF type:complete len:589 (-),score=134.96 TRINITY_DN9761_c0_g1_i1:82-1848(-)
MTRYKYILKIKTVENLRTSKPVVIRVVDPDGAQYFSDEQKAAKKSNVAKWVKNSIMKNDVNDDSDHVVKVYLEQANGKKVIGKFDINVSEYEQQTESSNQKFKIENTVKRRTKVIMSITIGKKKEKTPEKLKIDTPLEIGSPRPSSPGRPRSKTNDLDESFRRNNPELLLARGSTPRLLSPFSSSASILPSVDDHGAVMKLDFGKKYPSMPSPQRSWGPESPRIQRRVVSLNDVNLSEKEKYLKKKQEKEEEYLINKILKSEVHNNLDVFVIPYVVMTSLLHWEVFQEENEIIMDDIIQCIMEKIMNEPVENLFTWFSITTLLYYLIREEIDKQTISGPVIEEFKDNVFSLARFCHETLTKKVEEDISKKLTPIVLQILDGESVGKSSIGELHETISSYKTLCGKNPISRNIQKLLFKDIWSIYNDVGIKSLMDGQTNYGKGLLIKMEIISVFEQYVEEYREVKEEVQGFREAINVFCFPLKNELVDPAMRDSLWPTLSPDTLVKILENYKPDEYDQNGVSPGLLKRLGNLDNPQSKYINVIAKLDDESCPNFGSVSVTKEMLENLTYLNKRPRKSGETTEESSSDSW